ncbi:MAG: sugar ABC transporter substrate-binding protein [Eubacteriales bacterium]|nr:sugar ABC transporter substrate-binding protein [Eubacteriales bacterium]
MKKLFAVLLVVSMLFALAACGGSKDNTTTTTTKAGTTTKGEETTAPAEKKNITLIVKNLTNPMWIAVQEGAKAAAEEFGVNLTVLAPTVADSNEEQLDEVNQSIAKKEDAIVLIPADSKGIVPGVEAANTAGIPIINVNTKVDTSTGAKVETFIAVENYTAAVSVAEKLVEMMNKEGTVIILEGKAGAQSSVDIVAGAKDTFAKYSNIKIEASQSAQWSRAEAYAVTQNLLQSYPNVNAIFAANDEMAMGALEAVDEAGKTGQILITGLDANADARKAVDEGKLALTCNKNGYGQGYAGVKAAVDFLSGKTLEANIIVDTELYLKK